MDILKAEENWAPVEAEGENATAETK